MLCKLGACAGRPLARRIDSTMADISVRAIVAKAVAGNLLLLDCFSASSCVRDLRRRGASGAGEIDVARPVVVDDVDVDVESSTSAAASCRVDLLLLWLPFLCRRRLLEASVDEIDSLILRSNFDFRFLRFCNSQK